MTLCVVGQRILAVAGGNRLHDQGRRLQGSIEAIPDADTRSWASALRRQIEADGRYYDFYLRRISYGDDTPDDAVGRYYDFYLRRVVDANDTLDDTVEEAGRRDADPGFAVRPDPRGDGGHTGAALIHALAVAAGLATLAGWFVWLRLWQHRRRVATWIVTG